MQNWRKDEPEQDRLYSLSSVAVLALAPQFEAVQSADSQILSLIGHLPSGLCGWNVGLNHLSIYVWCFR
jgi:hypothetical protein